MEIIIPKKREISGIRNPSLKSRSLLRALLFLINRLVKRGKSREIDGYFTYFQFTRIKRKEGSLLIRTTRSIRSGERGLRNGGPGKK
jgi:hypothetical protein